MTLKEAIQLWETGEEIRTIEMGGICESYEMGIQMLAFALAKDGKIYNSSFNVEIPDQLKQFGYSGAQVGAAVWLSNQFIKEDYEGLFERAKRDGKEDRIIMMKNKPIEKCSTVLSED